MGEQDRPSPCRHPPGNMWQPHRWAIPRPQTVKGWLLLACPDEKYSIICQEMQQVPKAFQSTYASVETLHFATSYRPFYQWDVDILGPFHW